MTENEQEVFLEKGKKLQYALERLLCSAYPIVDGNGVAVSYQVPANTYMKVVVQIGEMSKLARKIGGNA